MFRPTFLVFLFCCANQVCLADDSSCTKLAVEAEASGISYHPPFEAKVIGNGKIGIYSSPNAECKINGVFVVKGNYLTVYKSYKGWINVMYVAKNGEDFIGWLPESKVKIVGQYGNNS